MTANEHEANADERFERLLLDSAQTDALPQDVDAAWQKFDSALRGVSVLAAGASGALAARRAQRWLTAKWLIWGALAGSALTAFSLRAPRARQVQPSALTAAPISAPAVVSSTTAAAGIEAPRSTTPSPQATPTATALTKRRPHSFATPTPATPSVTKTPQTPQRSSTLAAQVALLDAARSAIANGTNAEAYRLAERYRADFPNGELAPEAEVVAIEALVVLGSRAAASERAARFLARYPGDPHAARVKWLVR